MSILALFLFFNGAGNDPKMNKKTRQAKVTPETLEESRRLKALWDSHKDRPNQTIFGEKYEIGTQSAITSFLNGRTPISLKAARGFAKGLGCRIADFSPRLAALESSWPFELVDRERYEALPPALRYKAQVRMQDEVEALEEALKANGTIS